MKKNPIENSLDRRKFLKAAGTAGLAVSPLAHTQTANAADQSNNTTTATPPSSEQEAREYEGYSSQQADRYFIENPGSDFMVDVIKQLDIDFMATNPGTSFRGLQESIVNYGGNQKPELLTVTHEGIGATMAHGYFKASGKPMAVLVHGSVGSQHLPMAVYSAWCDRVPMIILIGNHSDVAERGGATDWYHSGLDLPAILRDFTKWDDTCFSLEHFADSITRAYKIAMTPPMGPVVIVIDAEYQESEIEGPRPSIPKLSPTIPPHADLNALNQIADWLVAAENPVLVASRMAQNQQGIDLLVELAELLQAGVVDQRGRVNFPSTHHLYVGGGAMAQADVIVGLELSGPLPGNINPETKVATIGVGDLQLKANYQEFLKYYPVSMSVAGEAQASLPYLTEAVRERLSNNQISGFEARGERWRQRHVQERDASIEAARYGWNNSPVATGRLYLEIWDVIKDRDWSMVSADIFQSSWGNRLWPIDKYYQYHGSSGSAGIGYGAPSAVGAALAHRDTGVLPVNIQKDGDLMFYPGVLWTAAHHNIPMLNIMHNNRAYHAETMIMQGMANQRRRGEDGSGRIATVLDDPPIDFSGMAKSMGIWSSELITNPNDLGPALRSAMEVIDAGEPALIDVHCSGR